MTKHYPQRHGDFFHVMRGISVVYRGTQLQTMALVHKVYKTGFFEVQLPQKYAILKIMTYTLCSLFCAKASSFLLPLLCHLQYILGTYPIPENCTTWKTTRIIASIVNAVLYPMLKYKSRIKQ